MARNVINVEDVIAAGQKVVATAEDVEIARTASNNNRVAVVGAADEIIASKGRVDQFISTLLNQVQTAESQVLATDWDSQSQRRFHEEISRFSQEVKALGARYGETYSEAVEAVNRLKVAVEDLDTNFTAACNRISPVLIRDGNAAIRHGRESGDLADNGLQFG